MKLLPFVTLSLYFAVGAGLSAETQPADFIPSNPPEMKPLKDKDSTAHKAAKLFLHGVNLGNYLEVPPDQNWGITVSADELNSMRTEGFDHVRVPIGWQHYTGPGPTYQISTGIFAKVDFIVKSALAEKLGVIVNIHHFDAFTSDPAAQTEKFLALWKQISTHYAAFPDKLAFELLNEPKDAAKTKVLNPIYAEAIAEIRKTNPKRTIFVGPSQWNSVDELKNLVLPEKDENLIVTVHCYDPFRFTHQGAPWAGTEAQLKGIQFPGPPEKPLVPDLQLKLGDGAKKWVDRYNTLPADTNPSGPSAFEGRMKLARAWSDYYGRPVHLGEFGCYTAAEPQSRVRFHRAFRRVLEEQGIGWCLWDWSAGFRYWDKQNNEPVQGMREALFGQRRKGDQAECEPRNGWPNVFARLSKGQETRIAYLGGSITAQDGWRPKTLHWFQERFPESKVSEINAAIGGTGSDLGVFRLYHDVLQYGPHLLFIEFAVNDSGWSARISILTRCTILERFAPSDNVASR